MSDYKIVLKKLATPLPGVRHWCLDFPRDNESVLAESLLTDGLLLQGWLLKLDGADVNWYLQQGEQRTEVLLNKPRPDVISAVLAEPVEQHPQLACGFRCSIPLNSAHFLLGVCITGHDYPLFSGQVQGAFQVLTGKDGWLFLDNDTNKSVEQFTGKLLLDRAERRNWKDYFKGLQKLATQLRTPFTMLMAPSKESVFPQFYPFTKANVTAIDQLQELAPADFPLLYPVAELQDLAQRSFRVTDTHWSVHGACAAAQLCAYRLGLAKPEIAALFANDVFYPKELVGDLGNKTFPPARHAEDVLKGYSYRRYIVYDNLLANFGRVLVIRNNEAYIPAHLLILGSSSAYSMLDYVSRIFGCVTLIHTAGNVDIDLVKQLAPDFLLTQTNARFVVRAPTLSYSLAEGIAEKLKAMPAELLQQQQGEVAAAALNAEHPVPVLHSFYIKALQTLL